MTPLRATAAAVTIAASFLSSGASAATTTPQVLSFSDVTNETLTFDAFDTALGTLTRATLAIDATVELGAGEVSGRTGFSDFSSLPVFDGFIDGKLKYRSVPAAGGAFNNVDLFNGRFFSCATQALAEICTAHYSGTGGAYSFSETSTDVSGFVGPTRPAISLVFETFVFLPTGGVTSGPTPGWTATGTLSLVYDFDPAPDVVVPVPAALPMALGGFALLFAVGYRRRSRDRGSSDGSGPGAR